MNNCDQHFMLPWPEMPYLFCFWLVNRLMRDGYTPVVCPHCNQQYFRHRLETKKP
jgi:hypothetical protein